MDDLQDILETVLSLGAAILPLALVIAVALFLLTRRGGAGVSLRHKIDGVQRRFNLQVLDKRIPEDSPLHDLMAGPLRQWPHDPWAFYQAALLTVEEMARAKSPITEQTEALSDQNVQELAAEFMHLMRAIAAFPNPGHILPRTFVRQARRARTEHLQRLAQITGRH
jgi:hypothetical protein